MKEISFEEIKLLQLEILKNIDFFCVKNGIKYSLAYGTLIGAVRHKGYIPWDDDIDIMMPRKDYERFISTFPGTYKHLSVLSPEINKNYYAPYANVYDNRTVLIEGCNGHRGIQIGIKVDIFPIDRVSANMNVYDKDMKLLENINFIMYMKRINKMFLSEMKLKMIIVVCAYKLLYFMLPYTFLQNKIKNIVNSHNSYNSDYVDNIVFNPYFKRRTYFNKSVLDNYKRVSFEGFDFNIVQDYDTVLKGIYGDYMQLPPIEKRVTHHNFNAFWKD